MGIILTIILFITFLVIFMQRKLAAMYTTKDAISKIEETIDKSQMQPNLQMMLEKNHNINW